MQRKYKEEVVFSYRLFFLKIFLTELFYEQAVVKV